jgi:ribonuclease Z
MFEVIFLGTSASAPSVYRNLPATIVMAGEHRFLIDCGEGTQRQILRSGIGFKKLNHILLTHAHLDHILGIGGVVSTFTSWDPLVDYLEIYGGRNTLERVETLIYDVVLRGKSTTMPIRLFELKPGPIFEAKNYTVSAFPVKHRGSGNFGFVFEEHARRPFQVERAEALGVPAGPERGRLVNGQAVHLADGRLITPDMVLGETIKGTKLVYIGDIGQLDNIEPYAQDADALIIEATFLESEAEEARSFGHVTARQVAAFARKCGVRSLLLNHVSRRYRERDIVDEAQSEFHGAVVVRDLDHYVVKRGQPTEKKEMLEI